MRESRRFFHPLLTAAAGLVPLWVHGDAGRSDSRNMAAQSDSQLPGVEFEFTRLVYTENPDFSRGWGWVDRRWTTDAPEAETHLLQGIKRLTRVNASSAGTALRLDNDAIFDRPSLDAVEVGGRAMSGRTWERDGYTPHWRGIHDENGRLSGVINFNMDMGDAWEHADSPQYPQPLTALAYRYAIDYLLYSMSH
ncbi:MAG: DUF4159 domain-containing protein [Gammaproteobacteria bacterium]